MASRLIASTATRRRSRLTRKHSHSSRNGRISGIISVRPISRSNRLEEAEVTFRKTVEVAGQTIPDEDGRFVDEREYGNRHWHLALVELLRGKYQQGFKRYRARFKDVGGLKRPNFARPVWQGESLSGKTILVQDEQGFGDTLMLARYLPLMKAQGAKILFSVHPVLQPFFDGWQMPDGVPVIERLLVHGDKIGDYDLHCSVFDLPYCFDTTLETIPAQVPYLPEPEPAAGCALPDTGQLRIGIVWGGSPLHLNDARRSVPLPVFARLFDNKNLKFFSLNRDLKAGDAEALPSYHVTDLAPRLKTFKDAARFIMQMDLVITCDTATAHLAGGLGKPVWILLPFAPDWRWLTDRQDTPWYRQARLFRQPRTGDWQTIIEQASEALSQFKNQP